MFCHRCEPRPRSSPRFGNSSFVNGAGRSMVPVREAAKFLATILNGQKQPRLPAGTKSTSGVRGPSVEVLQCRAARTPCGNRDRVDRSTDRAMSCKLRLRVDVFRAGYPNLKLREDQVVFRPRPARRADLIRTTLTQKTPSALRWRRCEPASCIETRPREGMR